MYDRTLNPHMTLKESGEQSGEFCIKEGILATITQNVCTLTHRQNIDEAHNKLRQASSIRFKTQSSYMPQIHSVPKPVVKHWTRSLSLVSVPGLYSDLDLESGKYEGGFKVWESTGDLIKFINEDENLISDLLHRGTKLRVLELGAGACLPSLVLIGRILADPIFEAEYRLHVQDYNWQVLASLSLMNFATNLPSDYFKALIDTKCLRFFYGDWKDFRNGSSYKYDLIMMSEVIYNSSNYDALHDLLSRHLKLHGYIVIATKDSYFGLSGGLYQWLDYVKAKKFFKATRIRVNTTNIPRSIVIMRRGSS